MTLRIRTTSFTGQFTSIILSSQFHITEWNKLFHQQTPQLRKQAPPPAFETRQRDGAVCPSKKTFNSAYLFVQKSKIPSRSKSFILSILNRTAPSKRKLFWCKIAKNEICELCNVVCDNYHVMAECMFSFMLVTALRKYLELKNIKLTENTFAFFAPIPNISSNFNSQIIHIICEVTRRVYSSIKHDRLT